MITCQTVKKPSIRAHYELVTLFYRLFWGRHIHHGLWEADEPPNQAQQQLIEHLVDAAAIPRDSRVLDVGCGMGGSSVYLSRRLNCDVTGITLSRVQQCWARVSAALHGAARKTRFLRQDAELAEFASASFDVVWSIECTEHLFDKPEFFRRAAQWLRPEGRIAICAWVAGDEPHTQETVQRIHDVCEGFLCPSFGTSDEYVTWLTDAGLESPSVVDLTKKVSRTWEICEQRVNRTGMPLLSKLFGFQTNRFVRSFRRLLEAYETGAMKYCSFTARAPSLSE